MALSIKQDGLRELALFAGAGGGILGGYLMGWKTVCAVEIEDYPRRVLLARQRDSILSKFPIWDDIKTFDGREWRGRVDVVSGGFPCQDISCAGKGKGISGERSGLWAEMARVISEVQPRFVLVENSPMLTLRGLGVVLGDLAQMGYDARWGVLGADAAGANHHRARIWVVAHSTKERRPGQYAGEADGQDRHPGRYATQVPADTEQWLAGLHWQGVSPVCRVDDGVAHWAHRFAAIGNGQVPAVAKLAWEILNDQKAVDPLLSHAPIPDTVV